MWFIRHKIKVIQHLAVTETDWSPFVEVCCVCMCVCIYYSNRSYTKVNRGTHWYIKHKYKKFLRVTKYKLFIFMATTQLDSGSFMVGMNCDCKSALMNKPHVPPCENTPPTPPHSQKKIILYNFLTPWNWNCTYAIYVYIFYTSVHSDFQQLWKYATMNHCFPVIPNFLVSHSRSSLCSEGSQRPSMQITF